MRRRRALVAIGVGIAAVVALVVHVGRFLAVTAPVEAPEAIVSLGSHEWERLPVAARLGRANPEAVVLLTRPLSVTEKNCYRCEERVEWLAAVGVSPQRVVLLPHRSRNTYDEATATFSYAATRGIRSIVVVTSPYHGRRALATFRSVFARAPVRVGVALALRESNAHPSSWWMYAYDRWYVGYESAALLMYTLRYGVNPLAI
jgi:uncharacterized SAM-binding protein YcdF (DUF218 family)